MCSSNVFRHNLSEYFLGVSDHTLDTELVYSLGSCIPAEPKGNGGTIEKLINGPDQSSLVSHRDK